MDVLALNIRYAVRRLMRAPFFTLVAILSLALGIGANTAIFSLVNAVIIRDVQLERPEELVDVFEASEGFSHGTLSYPDYLDLIEGSRDVFESVGGMQFVFVQADFDGGVETAFWWQEALRHAPKCAGCASRQQVERRAPPRRPTPRRLIQRFSRL